jgi:hypothetical protein
MDLEDQCGNAARQMFRAGARNGEMPWSRLPCRIWPLPLDSLVDIAAGATVALTTTVQYSFWGEVLVIGSDQAPFTRVENMFVATTNQQAANGAQRGTVFTEIAQQNLMNFDCAESGVDIVIGQTNTGAVARRLMASLFGIVKKKNC